MGGGATEHGAHDWASKPALEAKDGLGQTCLQMEDSADNLPDSLETGNGPFSLDLSPGSSDSAESSSDLASVASYDSEGSVASLESLMQEVHQRIQRSCAAPDLEQPPPPAAEGWGKQVIQTRGAFAGSPVDAAIAAVSMPEFGKPLPRADARGDRWHFSLSACLALLSLLLVALVFCMLAYELEWYSLLMRMEERPVRLGGSGRDWSSMGTSGLSAPSSGLAIPPPALRASSRVDIASLAVQSFQAKRGLEGARVQPKGEVTLCLRPAGPESGLRVPCRSEKVQGHIVSLEREGQDLPLVVVVRPPVRKPRATLKIPDVSSVRTAIHLLLVLAIPLSVLGITMVTHSIRHLAYTIKCLGDLNGSKAWAALAELRKARHLCIMEVCMLQSALEHFVRSVETFGRFMPLQLARSIILGNEQSMRLHVARGDVTIMFVVMRDLSSICRDVQSRDRLFMITRYLSAMTRIVEMYQGTVAEILDDGLLVFWNTPERVPDHAEKACAAALAMRHAAALLNANFATTNLPRLVTDIGLHTGPVLSGTLGSERKMKFGCMGDSVNLASRVAGLCRHFGVGVICSEATRQSLSSDDSFLARRLGAVKVKGRQEPTVVSELVGRGTASGAYGKELTEETTASGSDSKYPAKVRSMAREADLEADLPERAALTRDYEEVLDAFQRGEMARAHELGRNLTKAHPEDVAAARLQERTSTYVDAHGQSLLTAEQLRAWTGVLDMEAK